MARTAIYCTLDSQDAAIDEVISGCNGDMRGALKALMLVNEHLESELQQFYVAAAQVSQHEHRAKKRLH
jgi:hypothetical protein